MKDVIVIGIAGGTGSGKSTLIQKIKDEFSNEITMLSHDFYYKQHNEIPFEERKKLNYDHPNSFDTDLMIEHVRRLAMGQSINRPVYDFTIHNRVDETVLVEPAKVIIVEGILIFENKELRDLCDIKVYRYGCRCAHHTPYHPRCQRARQDAGVYRDAVSDNSKTDARAIRGTK